jgi:hypothetical protein
MIDMKERERQHNDDDLSSNNQHQKTAVTNLIFVVARLVAGNHLADRLQSS